ncbi:hypothetical protein [Gymnodinialimonas sp.]
MPPFYRLLQVNITSGATPARVHDALSQLWTMLEALRRGEVQDLRKELRPGDPDVVLDAGELQVLLGYGGRLFDDALHVPPLVDPDEKPRFLQPLDTRQPTAPFARLTWLDHEDPRLHPQHPNTTQSDLAFQFTGTSELAVNRAIVEVQKCIHDNDLPLRITNFFSGFRRDDKRSWIDFHDGINNMTPPERLVAMEVQNQGKAWLHGGTYMCFLRIHVDIEAWRRIPRGFQELIVGRNKLTACPIEDTTRSDAQSDVQPVFQSGCPMSGNLPAMMTTDFRDAPQPTDRIALAAHIFRSNLNRTGGPQSASSRIYRQGYEFLEPSPDGGVLQGLNFVGFIRDLKEFIDILDSVGWLGDANFGGLETATENEPPSIELMKLLHGCYYAVPPMGSPFPGSDLLLSGTTPLVASAEGVQSTPQSDVREIAGIGQVYQRLLNEAGIFTVADLAMYEGGLADDSTPEIVKIAIERGWVSDAAKLI